MSGQDEHEQGSGAANKIPESSSPPCPTTDERQFRRVDVPNAADEGLTTSFEDGSPWPPWSPSSLNSSVYFRNIDPILLENIHPREASRPSEQWYDCANVTVSTRCFIY